MSSYRYFTESEFDCPCCGANEIKPGFVSRLDDARDTACVAFKITSGFRCPANNTRVGGSSGSAHLLGIAADIETPSNYERFLILQALLKHGFKRIGVYPSHLHVDESAVLPHPIMWVKDYGASN